jgi:hypothetical protein
MPILLWYLPFTMFYGTCDLVFAELEMQVNEDRQAVLVQAGPEDEATQLSRPYKVVRTNDGDEVLARAADRRIPDVD